MKTVTFDDEAYELLRGLKISPKDSFSDVVKRHFGARRATIEDTAGAWSDMTDDEVRALRARAADLLSRPKPRRSRS